jgi:hypothetical protein
MPEYKLIVRTHAKPGEPSFLLYDPGRFLMHVAINGNGQLIPDSNSTYYVDRVYPHGGMAGPESMLENIMERERGRTISIPIVLNFDFVSRLRNDAKKQHWSGKERTTDAVEGWLNSEIIET